MASQTRSVDNTVSAQWADPDNAFSENDLCTSTSATGNQNVYNVISTPFTIPTGATINGIECKVIRGGDVDDYYSIELQDKAPAWKLKNGTAILAVCAAGVQETLGGPTDLWGGEWDPAHINSSSFQVRLTFIKTGKANTMQVDHIEVVIYYTPVSPPEGTFRKSHIINGTAVGEQTDYQVRVKVHRSAGEDSGEDVYVGTKCRANFGDIRFTKNDEVTPLDFWLESVIGTVAIFWVEIDTIPDSPGTVTIYIHYGAANETTISDIDATFLFGDDFKFGVRLGTWDTNETVIVESTELTSVECNEIMKREGVVRDDDHYFIVYLDMIDSAWLKKFLATDGSLVDTEVLTDGTLCHPGGFDSHSNGNLYIPMAENQASPVNPSKIKIYNKDLEYVSTLCTSAGVGDDHWGAVAIDEDNDRIYIANWGTAKIYTYVLSTGAYVSTNSSPPYANIQDMQYLNGYIYGSLSGSPDICVIRVSDWSAQGVIGVGQTGGVPHTYQGMCIYHHEKHNSENADGQFYLAPHAGGWSDADKKKVRKYERVELFPEILAASAHLVRLENFGPNVCGRAKIKFTGGRHNQFFCDAWPDNDNEDLASLRYDATDWILRTRIGAGGANDDDTGLTEDTSWHIWDLKWPSGSAELDFDGTNVASLVSAPTASMQLGFQNWGSATTDIQVMFVVLRKYVDPEPTHGDWGSEQGGEGWTGKIIGVTNPAKICGIPVADIAKVIGVA